MPTLASDDDGLQLDSGRALTGHKRRSDLSTARLLQAAAHLIADKGYGRTSLIEIAAQSGYSHGLVTLRFGSKEGLLRALFDRMTADWTAREIRPAITGRVGLDAIRALLDVTRAAIRRNPTNVRALYALMFEAVLGVEVLEERVRAFHDSQRVMYRDILARGIEAGVVRADTDIDEAASLIISLLRGAGYQWLLEPEYDLDHGLAVVADTLDRLLRA
jgi:AcrR family transcriptional regulator